VSFPICVDISNVFPVSLFFFCAAGNGIIVQKFWAYRGRYNGEYTENTSSSRTFAGLVTDPILLFEGLTDTSRIDEAAEQSIIQISAENRLIKLKEAVHRYYTPEDQQRDYPGDLGFNFVLSLQQKEIAWRYRQFLVLKDKPAYGRGVPWWGSP